MMNLVTFKVSEQLVGHVMIDFRFDRNNHGLIQATVIQDWNRLIPELTLKPNYASLYLLFQVETRYDQPEKSFTDPIQTQP